MVGREQVHLVTLVPIKDKVCWQVKKTVIHWGLFPVGVKIEPWVIAPDALSALGYVRWNILNEKRFHLRECLEDLCMQMIE